MIYSRRIRQRRGSANVMRVRGQSMAMAEDLERAILAESADWEAKVRADEHKRVMEFCCRDNAADLRAKVESLPDALTGDIPATVLDSAEVLALFPEEKPDE